MAYSSPKHLVSTPAGAEMPVDWSVFFFNEKLEKNLVRAALKKVSLIGG